MLFDACSLLMTLKTVHAILARHWFTTDGKPILFSKSEEGIFFFIKDKTKGTLINLTTSSLLFFKRIFLNLNLVELKYFFT